MPRLFFSLPFVPSFLPLCISPAAATACRRQCSARPSATGSKTSAWREALLPPPFSFHLSSSPSTTALYERERATGRAAVCSPSRRRLTRDTAAPSLSPLPACASTSKVNAPPSNGTVVVPFAPFGVVLRPAPRLADARPDREERRGHDGGATLGISFPSFLCQELGFLRRGIFLSLVFFVPKILQPNLSDTIVRTVGIG